MKNKIYIFKLFICFLIISCSNTSDIDKLSEKQISKFNPPSWIYGTYQDIYKSNIYTFSEYNIIATLISVTIDFNIGFSSAEVSELKNNTLYQIKVISPGVDALYKFEYVSNNEIKYSITNNGVTTGPLALYKNLPPTTTIYSSSVQTTTTTFNLPTSTTTTISQEDIAFLSSITTSEGSLSPVFNKEIFEYSIELDYYTTNINILFDTQINLSYLKINNQLLENKNYQVSDLIIGVTKLEIFVYSSNGNYYNIYNITINRLNEDIKNWNKKITIDYFDTPKIAIDSLNNIYLLYDKNKIKKYDSQGNEDLVNWNKQINEIDKDYGFNSFILDKNDNIILGGGGSNLVYSDSDGDWLIKKFDKQGKEDLINWDKKITNPLYNNDEYYYNDYITCLGIDSENNLIVGGNGDNLLYYKNYYDRSASDWWIKKFNNNGIEDSINWDKKINGTGIIENAIFGNYDSISNLTIDKNNNIFIVGAGYDNKDTQNTWIKKYNYNGIEDVINWNKKYKYSNIISIISDSYNYIYTYSFSDSYLEGGTIKCYNENGIEDTNNWNKKTNIIGYDMKINFKDELFILGRGNVDGTTPWNLVIRKFNRNGSENTSLWGLNKYIYKNIDGISDMSMAIDNDGNVFICFILSKEKQLIIKKLFDI